MFQQINKKVYLNVKVVTRSSKTEIIGWENNELKIRLAAVPTKGKANAALICFLAELFEIGKSRVFIEQGKTSRYKKARLEGIAEETMKEKIAGILTLKKK